MPTRKKMIAAGLPKDFSPYGEPHCYFYKPLTHLIKKNVIREEKGNYDLSGTIPEGTTSYYIETSSHESYGGIETEITIKFYGEDGQVENPHYEKELKRYEKEHQKYLIDCKNHKKYMKIYNELVEKETQENEERLYKKLKEKYE